MAAVKDQPETANGHVALDGVRLPALSKEDALYYAGIGAMTAFSLIEWPVTIALGAGYALATREAHQKAAH